MTQKYNKYELKNISKVVIVPRFWNDIENRLILKNLGKIIFKDQKFIKTHKLKTEKTNLGPDSTKD